MKFMARLRTRRASRSSNRPGVTSVMRFEARKSSSRRYRPENVLGSIVWMPLLRRLRICSSVESLNM